MEPLVVFGALLVAYCGRLAVLDTIRDRKTRRLARPVRRETARERAPLLSGACGPRTGGRIAVGRPLLQRV